MFIAPSCLLLVLLLVLAVVPVAADAPPEMPADYFAEPADLPFDVQPIAEKQEDGWHWREFLYTSLIYKGQPVRVHAIYAVPDGVDAAHKSPAIIATHGADTGTRGTAASWYWHVITVFAKAGYVILFYDWDFKPTPDWKADPPGMVKRFTDYGALDFRKTGYFSKENDFRDGLHYQAMLAGRRGVSWLRQQPEVDATNLAAFGSSYGGIFSSLLFAIEPRLKAANPEVYTTDYGLKEESYNMLPGGWTEAEAQAWRARFDSYVLLAKRQGPLLYTVGANDPTFLLTKAQRIFAAMPAPKHILIGPNQGHGYWDLDQSVLFFDEVLKGKIARPALSEMKTVMEKDTVVASVVAERAAKVEFFMAPVFEIDPDRGADAIPADAWTWTAVPAVLENGRYVAHSPLPRMRPQNARERVYTWGAEETLDVATPRAAAPVDAALLQGQVRIFARATGANGAMECSPLAEPVRFHDPAQAAIGTAIAASPVLEAAVRLKERSVVAIDATTPAGQPAATLPTVGPVGRSGYALWNWRQKTPMPDLATETKATPTKRILAPFTDTVKADSFVPQYWAYCAFGSLTSFTINGVPDLLTTDGRAYHGAIHRPGCGNIEELPLVPADDKEHRLTVVIPACREGGCNMRVSLVGADGTVTVRYRHTADRDQLLRFRFTGKVTLRLQMASQPKVNWMTLVGPSAIFLD